MHETILETLRSIRCSSQGADFPPASWNFLLVKADKNACRDSRSLPQSAAPPGNPLLAGELEAAGVRSVGMDTSVFLCPDISISQENSFAASRAGALEQPLLVRIDPARPQLFSVDALPM